MKILLTGMCWYELAGLKFLLLIQGHDVNHLPLGHICAPYEWDLIIVAISSEPVAGWGRYLPVIYEIRKQMLGEMLVFVPARLKDLKILRSVCPIYNGDESLNRLSEFIHMSLSKKYIQTSKFRLTRGQRQALIRFKVRGRYTSFNLKRDERKLYWHYYQLAKCIGVRNFKILLITRLDEVISSMEAGAE